MFLAPTGFVRENLIEAEYLQGASRFLGGEAGLDVALSDRVWLLIGLDYVDARLTKSVVSPSTGVLTLSGTALPRIPPLRIRFGTDIRFQNVTIRSDLIAAEAQSKLFTMETRTAGYVVANFKISYTLPGKHAVQVFSLSALNIGNKLYHNHLSFIKDMTPEIGRSFRLAYTLRFF